uniref:Kunitz/Bovine pancreatic trypsin inhibitor domain protein n=1 Tax=Macrostomum lignano TaxID=282301 RepID=A0A1I8GEN6_9PLAT
GNTCDSDLTEAGDELFATSDDLDHEKGAYVGGWLLFRFFKTECKCEVFQQELKGKQCRVFYLPYRPAKEEKRNSDQDYKSSRIQA